MQVTNDPIPAFEEKVDDITICATGLFDPDHRIITISQPDLKSGEDDFILFSPDLLPQIIKELQLIQAAYGQQIPEETHPQKGA